MIYTFIVLAILLQNYGDNLEVLNHYSIFIQEPSINYEIQNNKAEKSLAYKPNISSYSGITIGTEYLNISIAYKEENDNDLEESQAFDIQITGVKNKFLWDIYYQNYQGLYLNNIDEESIFVKQRANAFSYGGGIKYFFNETYLPEKSLGSYKPYKQRETNWSWLTGVFYNKNSLTSNNGNFIPESQKDNYPDIYGLDHFSSNNYGAEVCITGMYTYSGFHISSLIATSVIQQYQKYNGIDLGSEPVSNNGSYIILDLGYSRKNKSVGMNLYGQRINSEIENSKLDQSRSVGQFYYKYYF